MWEISLWYTCNNMMYWNLHIYGRRLHKNRLQTRHVLRRRLAPKGYPLFGLNALKDTTKAPGVDLLKPNTLRDNKTASLTTKGTTRTPVISESLLPPGIP